MAPSINAARQRRLILGAANSPSNSFSPMNAPRKIYEARQACLRHYLLKYFSDEIEVFGGSGGTHLTVVFNAAIEEAALTQAAANLNATAKPLSAFFGTDALTPIRQGLVLGYGAADETLIGGCVHRLKLAYDDTRAMKPTK